jgi:hypothetical protein
VQLEPVRRHAALAVQEIEKPYPVHLDDGASRAGSQRAPNLGIVSLVTRA